MLNKKYRRQDRITDVLAFADGENGQLGEVIIDYPQIVRQAQRFGHSIVAGVDFYYHPWVATSFRL